MYMWLSSIRLGFPRKCIHPTQNNHNRLIFAHGGSGGGSFKWASSQAALALWNSSSSHSDESSDDNSVTVCTTNVATNGANRTHCFSELDTSGVVSKLNCLRNEPNLAISFFHRVKGDGFRHNVYTYSALIRILCCWGLDRKLDSLFVNLINCCEDLEFEISDLMEAIEEGIEVSPSMIRAYDALLKSFVSLNMFDEAIDVLFQTKRRGFVPHIFTSNFLMNRLVEHSKVDMAVAIYKQLKRIGMNPNDYTYAIVIKGLCKKGSLEEAVEVFQEMQEAGVTPSAFAYTAYIEGLCTNHRPDLGYQVLQLGEHTTVSTLAEIKKNHKKLLSENKHVKYLYIPYTNTVVVVKCNPVSKWKGPPKFKPIYSSDEAIQHVRNLYRECLQKYRVVPDKSEVDINELSFTELRDKLLALDPLDKDHVVKVNQAEAEFWKKLEGYRVGWSDEILGFDCGGQQWVSETCFLAGTLAKPSMKDLEYIEGLKQLIEKVEIPAPAPIEQLWTACTKSPMSPASSTREDDIFSWVI